MLLDAAVLCVPAVGWIGTDYFEPLPRHLTAAEMRLQTTAYSLDTDGRHKAWNHAGSKGRIRRSLRLRLGNRGRISGSRRRTAAANASAAASARFAAAAAAATAAAAAAAAAAAVVAFNVGTGIGTGLSTGVGSCVGTFINFCFDGNMRGHRGCCDGSIFSSGIAVDFVAINR